MLYQKQIDQITWDDIVAFCVEGIPENTTLDYKVEFPNDLSKLISAFANTLGGIILIGIQEDLYNKPVSPISGIKFVDGLSEKVTNISVSNITPPIIPEVQICPNEDGSKAIIVIRVHQSHETPHAITNNTRVYVRVNDTTNPIKQADLTQVSWLENKRNKSVGLRERLVQRADKRFNDCCGVQYNSDSSEEIFGLLTISLCPMFPKDELMSPPDLNIKYQDFRVLNYPDHLAFPFPDVLHGVLAQEGIINHNQEDAPGRYTELSGFGLYFYRQVIQRTTNNTYYMPRDEIIARIAQFIDSARLFYEVLGYFGVLNFNVNLQIINNCPMLFRTQHEQCVKNSIDTSVDYQLEIPLTTNLAEDFVSLVHKPIQRIGWAFGENTTLGFIEYHLNNIRR